MFKEEKDILKELNKGSEYAFEYFFKKYYQVLFSYASEIMKNKTMAEEIVAEIFTHIWEKKETLHLHGSPKAYFFKAVYNKCMNELKHQKIVDKYKSFFLHHISNSELITSENSYPLPGIVDREIAEELRKSIDKLPDQCRKILMLSRIEEKKNQEIADMLGISINTVKTQLLRAIKRIRIDLYH